MKSVKQNIIEYLDSKHRRLTIEDIDTAAEYYLRNPLLTVEWWRFFLGNRGQSPKAFFVMGQMLKPYDKQVYKTESLIERDKIIVIPIDNWISVSPKKLLSNRKNVETTLRKLAIERMDRVTRLQLTIDNQPTQSEPRILSPLFEIEVNHDNLQTLEMLEVGSVKAGQYFAISDGYWLFIEPDSLSYGPHIIQTFGSCATGALELEMSHTLRII